MNARTKKQEPEVTVATPLDFPPADGGVLEALDTIELMVQHATPEVRATVRNEVKKIRAALSGE